MNLYFRSSPSRTSPNGSKQNLVSKQIERLYGDTLCQVRMTSPESLRSPGSDDSNGHNDSNGGSPSLNGDSEKVGRKHSGKDWRMHVPYRRVFREKQRGHRMPELLRQ